MDVTELIDRYCEVWNEPDIDARRDRLAEVFDVYGSYIDPNTESLTQEALVDYIDGIQKTRPNARVERISTVDLHHGWARFAWRVLLADGSALPAGLDVVRLSDDGLRLVHVLGFFGPLRAR